MSLLWLLNAVESQVYFLLLLSCKLENPKLVGYTGEFNPLLLERFKNQALRSLISMCRERQIPTLLVSEATTLLGTNIKIEKGLKGVGQTINLHAEVSLDAYLGPCKLAQLQICVFILKNENLTSH